jgi:uncharacterized protein (TIGR02246 family)
MHRLRIAFFSVTLLAGACLTRIAVSSTAAAGKPNERDQAAIQKLMDTQQTAWNRGDVDTFMTIYWRSPDVTFSGSSGMVRGWDAVLARYKKSYADREAMGQLKFSSLEYHFLGPDAALLLGHWHLTRAKGDVGGVFSLVWQRFPEGWRIIHDHTSAVPDTK